MKFPFVPLDSIMSEVQSQFKLFNKQGTYNEDDAYNYAIEAAREIGMSNYDDSTVGIVINGHVGVLPKDFYLVGEIWEAESLIDLPPVSNIADAFKMTIAPECLRKKQLLMPGDSSTVQFCKDKRTPFVSPHQPSYTIKGHRLRTSFKTGVIGLQYHHLSKDERGVVQIQDEINTIKAIKAGILMNMLKEDYVMQKVPRYIYKDIEDEYYTYLDQAQGIHKMPDPSADKFYAQQIHHRYDPFKL